MRLIPAPALLLYALSAGPAFAGDTTYSRTQAVPKACASSRSSMSLAPDPSDETQSYSFVSSSSEGRGGDFMTRCMEGSEGESHTLGEAAAGILALPIRAGFCGMAYGLFSSHAHLFAGEGRMDDWDDGRWRMGWGFGLGAAFMPGAAGGLPLELNYEATDAIAEDWQLRLRSGFFAHLMGSSVDYRRDVFVDGQRVGSQLDVMTGYIQSGATAFVDGIRLLSGQGLYLAGGAGIVPLHETIDYDRREGYGPVQPGLKDDRWQVLPAVDAALGRYGGGGRRSFWRFEIRYQAILHFPGYATSFPGDNADVTHSVTWQWAWF